MLNIILKAALLSYLFKPWQSQLASNRLSSVSFFQAEDGIRDHA